MLHHTANTIILRESPTNPKEFSQLTNYNLVFIIHDKHLRLLLKHDYFPTNLTDLDSNGLKVALNLGGNPMPIAVPKVITALFDFPA